MAKKSNQLFDLIKSLSSKEQDTIKLILIASYNETNPIINLFSSIANQEECDDATVFELVKKDFKTLNNYRVHKNKLYHIVLNYASALLNDHSIDHDLRSIIQKGYFLVERELHEQALSFIIKGIEIAQHFQRPLPLLQLLRLKIICLQQSSDFDAMDGEADKIRDEAIAKIALLKDYFTVYALELHSQKYIRKTNLQTDIGSVTFYQSAVKNQAYSKETLKASLEIKISRMLMEAFLSKQKQTIEKGTNGTDYSIIANLYTEFLKALSPHEAELLGTFPKSHLAILNNLTVNATNHSMSGGEAALKVFKDAQFTDRTTYKLQQAICFSESLRIDNAYADESKFKSTISEYEAFFKKYEQKLSDHHRMRVYYHLGEGYFIHAHYKEALQIYNKILRINKESPQIRVDIAQLAHLMILLIGYKTNRSRATIFRYLKATKVFFNKYGGLSPIETSMLDYFRNAVESSNKEQRDFHLKEFSQYLNSTKNNYDAQQLYSYFAFDVWFSCELLKQDYKKEIRKINLAHEK